jgi:hypothetical protein
LPAVAASFPDLVGTWYINTAGTASPPNSIGTVYFNRDGTYAFIIYGEQYVTPPGTSYNLGPYLNTTLVSGQWIPTSIPTIGDNYWIRFSGRYNIDAPGARIDGYNVVGGVASPLIQQTATGNRNFNSGWLKLDSDRAIAINSGGDANGGEGRLLDMKIEISSDVAGTTVLSTTSGVNIIAGTFYTGTT